MRTIRMTAVFLLLTVFVVGCTDQPVPTASADRPAAEPLFNFLNGPDNPGASGVVRFENVILVATEDPARDVLAFHFQADDFVACGGGSFFENADFQVVGNQEARRAIMQLVEAPIVIYRLSTFDGSCPAFANWLYRGTHTVRVRDNDGSNDGPGGNAFGWNGQGEVLDPGGNPFRYTEHQQHVNLPNGEFKTLVQDILLR